MSSWRVASLQWALRHLHSATATTIDPAPAPATETARASAPSHVAPAASPEREELPFEQRVARRRRRGTLDYRAARNAILGARALTPLPRVVLGPTQAPCVMQLSETSLEALLQPYGDTQAAGGRGPLWQSSPGVVAATPPALATLRAAAPAPLPAPVTNPPSTLVLAPPPAVALAPRPTPALPPPSTPTAPPPVLSREPTPPPPGALTRKREMDPEEREAAGADAPGEVPVRPTLRQTPSHAGAQPSQPADSHQQTNSPPAARPAQTATVLPSAPKLATPRTPLTRC